MNCLWLILILACCNGQSFCGNDENWNCGRNDRDRDCGCGSIQQRGGNRRRDNDCGCRVQEDDCGCDDGPRRRSVSSMPSFGRGSDDDTCGCDIQED